VLHHLEGRPLASIAEVLGIPLGTAKSRLSSARKSLERALEREEAR
jgi:DNA-directed RNA polymerase specialized sigma24 family protein